MTLSVDPRELLRRYICETFFVDSFADGDSFLRKGIIDSTGMMELVAFMEERLGVSVRDDELVPENLDSLDNLCRFIGRKRGAVVAAGA